MRDEEIRQRIASFQQWHYRFDLKGNLTPIFEERFANRHEQRKRYSFDPLVQLFGGSLAGKRILDLGCNAGFWSLNAVRAGCDYVLGIDGRQMHVDQANFVLEVEEVERDKYDFVAGDLFKLDFREYGRFDIVLCLGLMYHVSKHVELMEKISEVNDDVLLIDTALSRLSGPYFKVRRGDRLDEPRSAVDYELVMVPTWEAVRELALEFGYEIATLKPRFDNYEGSEDYRRRRRAFLCAKRTDVARVPAEIENAPPPGWGKPGGQPAGSRGQGDRPLEDWLRQTDLALSELFASRRWKLANALGDAGRRVLRMDLGSTPEDRLLALKEKLRARLEDPGRDAAAKRGQNRGVGRPEGQR